MIEQGKKYIHYCWFGNKPLPRLAKKCIKSWKKYLPNYEIICWNEKNSNLEECPFVKEAYENKKWAFVADYVRTRAIYEYGGIYFDTDMMITKDISFLLKKETFLGIEDSGAVAIGVWGANKSNSIFAKKMLEFYRSQEHFPANDLYSCTIPAIATKILKNFGFKANQTKIQKLKHDIYVYPREYFYPLSYNYHNNNFTSNTCMIHYYDASWTSKNEKRTIWMIRKFGPKNSKLIIFLGTKIKGVVKYYLNVLYVTFRLIFSPITLIVRRCRAKKIDRKNTQEIIDKIRKIGQENSYIVFCRKDWMGVLTSTKSLFQYVIQVPDISKGADMQAIANTIKEKKIRLVVFSALSVNWEELARVIKKTIPEIKIKIFWHGSNAMHIEWYDWDRFKTIFSLLREEVCDSVAFAKKSMYEQYKQLGYNVEFLANTFCIDKEKNNKNSKINTEKVKIGIYSSGNRWVKNVYNQIAAASLIKNSFVDIIPISETEKEFSQILKLEVSGSDKSVSHEEILRKISSCDIVLYTTFVECAPMLPLECLELDTLCITGNNHHYWENTKLEEYLVEPKVDNPVAIAKKIEYCLKNRETIFNLYRTWKKEYDIECEKRLQQFLGDK